MSKETMNAEEAKAVKELIEKIPSEDLEMAVGGMDEHTKEILQKFFYYIGISAAALGTGMLINKYWPRESADAPSKAPSKASVPAQRVYRYKTDAGIKKAYKEHRLKNMKELKNAYQSLHPDFKGHAQDVLTILGL